MNKKNLQRVLSAGLALSTLLSSVSLAGAVDAADSLLPENESPWYALTEAEQVPMTSLTEAGEETPEEPAEGDIHTANVDFIAATGVATVTLTTTKDKDPQAVLAAGLEGTNVTLADIVELHVVADESLGLNADNTLELTVKGFKGYDKLEVLTFGDFLTIKSNKLSSATLKGLAGTLREFSWPTITETSGAFWNYDKLEYVELGDVGTMGAFTFAGCTSLQTIKLYAAKAPALVFADGDPEDSWFDGVDTTAVTVLVPKWDERVTDELPIIDAFRNDTNWGDADGEEGMNYNFKFEEYDEPRYISVAYLPDATQEVVIDDAIAYGGLGKAVDKYCKDNGITRSDIKTLTLTNAILGPDDCAFVRTGLKMLEELYVTGDSNFSTDKNNVNGIIPNSAFRSHGRLKKVVATNPVEVSSDSFGLIPTLEFLDLPSVEKLQTRAFAMQKFSNNSMLKEIRLPNLKWMSSRTFYYHVRLDTLILGPEAVIATAPEGKEGLWFSYSTKVHVYIPGTEEAFNAYTDPEQVNESGVFWGAFPLHPYRDIPDNGFGEFVYEPEMDTGFEFPEVEFADEYNDRDYDYLREIYKNPTNHYYTGDVDLSLNMYSFNSPINRAVKNGQAAFNALDMDKVNELTAAVKALDENPDATAEEKEAMEAELWEFLKDCYGETTDEDITTIDAIDWAMENGFKAVDLTFYYVPGYTNVGWMNVSSSNSDAVNAKNKAETQAKFELNVRFLKLYCENHGVSISGTGMQNSFSDSSASRVSTDIERMEFYLSMSDIMGAPCMRVFTGTIPVDNALKGWQVIMDERVIPAMEAVAQYAQDHGLSTKLGIQNHGDMLATGNQVLYMVDEMTNHGYGDNIAIVNDTGYYREFGEIEYPEADWCYKEVERVLPVSGNFQLKKKPRGAESEAFMDLERVFTDIRKSYYLDPLDGSKHYVPLEVLWAPGDAGEYPNPENTSNVMESYKAQIIQYREMVEAAIAATEKDPNGGSSGGNGGSNKPKPPKPVEPEVKPADDLTDISGHWAEDAISSLVNDGLMNGITETTFAPNGTLTRGMMVTLLHRMEKTPAAAAAGFVDVDPDAWFAAAVNWGAANGLVKGYTAAEFGPDDAITREQLAAILYNYAKYKDMDVTASADLSSFGDGAAVGAWAADAMNWAVAHKLVSGRPDGTLDPQGTATRAEVAAILVRFLAI